MNLLEVFSKINTFVFDVDGVLTDGSLTILQKGEFVRTMHIRDGYALQLAIKKGYHVFVITGSHSDAVAERLQYLGITEFHQKVADKKVCLEQLLEKYAMQMDSVLFMGDDMPDLEAMQQAGLSCCPADAAIDILKIANYIADKNGGKGCVRDVIEKVMKIQGKWDAADFVKSI